VYQSKINKNQGRRAPFGGAIVGRTGRRRVGHQVGGRQSGGHRHYAARWPATTWTINVCPARLLIWHRFVETSGREVNRCTVYETQSQLTWLPGYPQYSTFMRNNLGNSSVSVEPIQEYPDGAAVRMPLHVDSITPTM
jgi:hypothetical protein